MSAAVCVQVTDLRREPVKASLGYKRDLLQETQLLYGEKVRVLQHEGEWSYVEALDQPKWTKDGEWAGYPGWILSCHLTSGNYDCNAVVETPWEPVLAEPRGDGAVILSLPFGAFFRVAGTQGKWQQVELIDGTAGFMRKGMSGDLLARAAGFIGSPYLWGGCSPRGSMSSRSNTSVDCSGLVHLLYRSFGVRLPRDARDQHKAVRQVEKVGPGDLVFRADPAKPDKIDHVMLVAQGEELIEACLDAGCVRRVSSADKFGVALSDLRNGMELPGHVIYCSSVEGSSGIQNC